MAVTLDNKTVLLISSFQSLTGANVKDVFEEDGRITFIVDEGEASRAIGRGGRNVKLLGSKLKKDIRVVEYNKDKLKFILNLIYPVVPKKIYTGSPEDSKREGESGGQTSEEIVTIEVLDGKSKGLLIGRNASSLRSLEEKVRRHHKVKEIKIR